MLKGHGNNIADYGVEIVADFSSNVLYPQTHSSILHFISGHARVLSNYPDTEAKSLSDKLANHHQVSPGNILVVNGATEAFYLLAQLFSGSRSIIFYPSFSEYEDACTIFNHRLKFVKTGTLLAGNLAGKLVWIGNPNNPDGHTMPGYLVEQYCHGHPDAFFVIDEAYAEQCFNFNPSTPLINKYKNIAIVRSLTKPFGIPGIRLGYLVSSFEIIKQLNKIRIPWSVNSLALSTGGFVMDHYETLLGDKNGLLNASLVMQEKFKKIRNVEVFDSGCNFFLARLLNGSAAELKGYLINNHGYLIRDASNFRGLNDGYFRVSALGQMENQGLYNAIERWVG